MAVTEEDLALFVGLNLDGMDDSSDRSAEETRVSSAFASAETDVDLALTKTFREVPESTRDRLVLEVGHAYYKRNDSPSGSSQGIDFSSGQPVLGPRDPLAQVWPILRRYVLPF